MDTTASPLPNRGPATADTADEGATRGPARRWARLRPWALPGFFALIVGLFLLATPDGVAVVAEGWWSYGNAGLWTSAPTTLPLSVGWALDLLSVGAVLLSRRAPVAATLVAVLPFATIWMTGTVTWGWWLALLCIAVVAAVDDWRRAIVPAVAAIALSTAMVVENVVMILPIGAVWPLSSSFNDSPAQLRSDRLIISLVYAAWVLVSVTFAASLGAVQRSRAASRRAVTATRQATESQARTAERARLAHDLHDVVAHHVSLVAVRAESAPYLHPDLDDDARTVLAAIATDAREALGELRQVLAVLQRSEHSAPELAPQPGAGDVVGLVEAAKAAGQDVTLTADHAVLDGVPAGPGYALFRAVQESLTNARRHAPGQPVAVRLGAEGSGRGRSAVLRVSNPVAGGSGGRTGGVGGGEPGRGLTGMRERVEALDGTLSTGMSGDGETFVVEVRIRVADVPSAAAGTGDAADPSDTGGSADPAETSAEVSA